MIVPSGRFINWVSTVGIEAEKFEKAQSLFLHDNYAEAMIVLEANMVEANGPGMIDGEEALALYAWVLFFLKRGQDLERLFDYVGEDGLDHFPSLNIVFLRRLIQKGETSRALDLLNAFLDTHLDPISKYVPDYLFAKGIAEYKSGNAVQAAESLETAFSMFSLLGKELSLGLVGNYLGFVNLRISRYQEAHRWNQRSVAIFSKLGLNRKKGMALLNSGITQYKVGSFQKALTALRESHQIGVDGKWDHRQLFSNIALGNVFRIKRDFKKARQHLHAAYGQAQKLQFPREEALALEFLGDVYRDERLFVDAERFYNRAMSIAKTIAPKGDIVMEVHRRLGEVCLAEDDLKGAQDHLAKALKLAKIQEDRYEEAVILRVVASVWEILGQAEESRRSIEESITILEEIGAKHELAISLMAAAELAMGEIERGRPSLPVDVMLTRAWTKATRSLEKFLQVDISYWTRKSQLLVKKISAMRQSQSATQPRARQGKAAEELAAYQPANVIIHQSRSMKDLLQLCDMFSETDEPALIVGETGTGKELLAHRLHELSPRAGNELVCVNVSAISESLFEREVFGHVRGSFTGADHDRIGLAERANGGTLFLDEIGDLPLEVQPKLLRLLQDGTYFAVGDPVERRTDIRLVAATNADLNRKVQNGEFRSDLYYRLKILEMELPPLRERPEDIFLLLRHFLGLNAGCPQDLTDYFDRDSLDHLERYEWPGNVREIAMVAARAHVEMKAKGSVEIILLRPNGGRIRITNDSGSILRQQPDKGPASSDAVERTRILMAIEECGGCRSKAAEQLDMSRATLYRHMMRLGLRGA